MLNIVCQDLFATSSPEYDMGHKGGWTETNPHIESSFDSTFSWIKPKPRKLDVLNKLYSDDLQCIERPTWLFDNQY